MSRIINPFLGWSNGLSVYAANSMNQHANIYGGSGSGKTTQMILMAEDFHYQGGTVFVLNYSGIFDSNRIYKPLLPYYVENIKEYHLHEDGIPINLFKPKVMNDGTTQNTIDVKGDVCDAFANAAKLTDKQRPTLRSAIDKLVSTNKYDIQGIQALDTLLSNAQDVTSVEIRERLYYILMHNVFRPSDDDLFFELNKLNVMNLSGFNWSAQKIITEVLLNEILSVAQTGIFMDHPLMVIIDEVQNFGNESIIPRLLNEGRKYGLGIVTGTQLILKGSTNKITQRLPGAGLNLIFKPQFNRIGEVAKSINSAETSRYAVELGNLNTGEFIALGTFKVGDIVFENSPLIVSSYIDENDVFLEETLNRNVDNEFC